MNAQRLKAHALRYSVLADGATTTPLCPDCGSPIPQELLVDPEILARAKEALASGQEVGGIPTRRAGECDCPHCGAGVEFGVAQMPVFKTRLARRIKVPKVTLQ